MDFTIAQGDTLPALTATLTAAGQPVDLTDAAVTVSMADAEGNPVFTGRPCTVAAPATGGQVTYGWQAGDTATYGPFAAQFLAVWAGGGRQTFPNGGSITVAINPAINP